LGKRICILDHAGEFQTSNLCCPSGVDAAWISAWICSIVVAIRHHLLEYIPHELRVPRDAQSHSMLVYRAAISLQTRLRKCGRVVP